MEMQDKPYRLKLSSSVNKNGFEEVQSEERKEHQAGEWVQGEKQGMGELRWYADHSQKVLTKKYLGEMYRDQISGQGYLWRYQGTEVTI